MLGSYLTARLGQLVKEWGTKYMLILDPDLQDFDIGDKIGVALEKIKKERPEEYEKAYNNRMVILRDKQWKEVIKQQNKNQKK